MTIKKPTKPSTNVAEARVAQAKRANEHAATVKEATANVAPPIKQWTSMTRDEAKLMGFGSLWRVAEDYARSTAAEDYARSTAAEGGTPFTDGRASPFPQRHDQGKQHAVWLGGTASGSRMACTDKAAKAKQDKITRRCIVFAIQNARQDQGHDAASVVSLGFTIAALLRGEAG